MLAARIPSRLLLIAASLLLCLAFAFPAAAAGPAWLEPRALSITDLAGQVPDSVLKGMIVCSDNAGLAIYDSCTVSGDTLRITVQLYPRVSHPDWLHGAPLTDLSTLGQTPHYDNWGTAVPESWVRVYQGSQDMTSQIKFVFLRDPALVQPLAGAGEYVRYNQWQVNPLQFGTDGLRLPANFGGSMQVYGDYPQLTAVFTVHTTNRPRVHYLGTQNATWQTYIGPGSMGAFTPLMGQLEARYGDRHARISLQVPAGADYIGVIYPPSPGDPYHTDPANRSRPVGGTVRLSPGQGMLTKDMMYSGPIPLNVGWQDADQSAGPYLSVLHDLNLLTPPEVVLPAGMPYSNCFTTGNCSDSTLAQIHDAVMPMQIIYLSVDPASASFSYVPLKMADTNWQPGTQALPAAVAPSYPWHIYLPSVQRAPAAPANCPCGAFTTDGRMVGYIP